MIFSYGKNLSSMIMEKINHVNGPPLRWMRMVERNELAVRVFIE